MNQGINFYLNPKMQQHLSSHARVKALIAGRGFGKSFGNGISTAQKVEYLSRGTLLFISETYSQILTRTLLPMISAWEKLNYFENYHYVIGRRPPKFFQKPYQPPQRHENAIYWFTGLVIQLGSMDRFELIRGGNVDAVIADEALNIPEDPYKKIIIPTLRGSDIRMQGRPHFKNQEFTSSMPYSFSKGTWILDLEERAKSQPHDVSFIEGTSYDNLKILGEDTLREWRRDMHRIAFDVECKNRRVKNFGNSFYPKLEDRHFYAPKEDYNYIDNLEFNFNERKGATIKERTSLWDADCDRNKPLFLTHDWGTFNCLLVDQVHEKGEHELRFLKSMHVKQPKTLDDLALEFCRYYRGHQNKQVFQGGDKSGTNAQANSKLSYFQQFNQILQSHGWKVHKQPTYDVEHLERHQFINRMLQEDDRRLPKIRINEQGCKDLRISLENATFKGDKKNKGKERDPNVDQATTTHYSDAFDYRCYLGFIKRIKGGASDAGLY
jgi:hypothetical protein